MSKVPFSFGVSSVQCMLLKQREVKALGKYNHREKRILYSTAALCKLSCIGCIHQNFYFHEDHYHAKPLEHSVVYL